MINHLLTNLLSMQIFGRVGFASAGRSGSSRSDCLHDAGIAVIDSILSHPHQDQARDLVLNGGGRRLPRWNSQVQGARPYAVIKKIQDDNGLLERASLTIAQLKTTYNFAETAEKFARRAENSYVVLQQRGDAAGSMTPVDPPNIARHSI